MKNRQTQVSSARSDKRVFVGLPVNEEGLSIILKLREALQQQCKDAGVMLRFTPDQKLHLTLLFIGQVAAEKVTGLVESLNRIDSPGVLTLPVEGLIALPSQRHARVIALKIENTQTLDHLHQSVVKLISQSLDVVENTLRGKKPFLPHITLARNPFPSDVSNILAALEEQASTSLTCEKLVLYESLQEKGEYKYLPLQQISL